MEKTHTDLTATTTPKSKKLLMVGRAEWVLLPDWGIKPFVAKIDTGADGNTFHGRNIHPFKRDGKRWLRFDVQRVVGDDSSWHTVEARVVRRVKARSSNGIVTKRYVVRTNLKIGKRKFKTDVAIFDRSEMEYAMLVGCLSLRGRFVVNVAEICLQGVPVEDIAGRP